MNEDWRRGRNGVERQDEEERAKGKEDRKDGRKRHLAFLLRTAGPRSLSRNENQVRAGTVT